MSRATLIKRLERLETQRAGESYRAEHMPLTEGELRELNAQFDSAASMVDELERSGVPLDEALARGLEQLGTTSEDARGLLSAKLAIARELRGASIPAT